MTSEISLTFAFKPLSPCVVGEYPEKSRDGAWEFSHIQIQGCSCDLYHPPRHHFQRTDFLLLKQIYGEAFPSSN